MTCRSCHHSIANERGNGLICQVANVPTPAKRCTLFEYQPGTDEGETNA